MRHRTYPAFWGIPSAGFETTQDRVGDTRSRENDPFSGMPGHIVTDAGTTQGIQVTAGPPTGTATIRLVSPKMLYVRGNSTFLEGNQMTQQNATKYAGKWIAIPSSSTYLQEPRRFSRCPRS
jgi:hypothetical protein